jgi:hypothetical protein
MISPVFHSNFRLCPWLQKSDIAASRHLPLNSDSTWAAGGARIFTTNFWDYDGIPLSNPNIPCLMVPMVNMDILGYRIAVIPMYHVNNTCK